MVNKKYIFNYSSFIHVLIVIITQYFKEDVESGSYKFFQLLDEIETL